MTLSMSLSSEFLSTGVLGMCHWCVARLTREHSVRGQSPRLITVLITLSIRLRSARHCFLPDEGCFYPHVTDGETEARGGEVTCQGHVVNGRVVIQTCTGFWNPYFEALPAFPAFFPTLPWPCLVCRRWGWGGQGTVGGRIWEGPCVVPGQCSYSPTHFTEEPSEAGEVRVSPP